MAKNEKRVTSRFDVIQKVITNGKKSLRQLTARYSSFYDMIGSFLTFAGVFLVFKVHSTTRLVPQTYKVASNSTMIVRVTVVCSE